MTSFPYRLETQQYGSFLVHRSSNESCMTEWTGLRLLGQYETITTGSKVSPKERLDHSVIRYIRQPLSTLEARIFRPPRQYQISQAYPIRTKNYIYWDAHHWMRTSTRCCPWHGVWFAEHIQSTVLHQPWLTRLYWRWNAPSTTSWLTLVRFKNLM